MAAAAQGSAGETARESCYEAEGMMLFRPGTYQSERGKAKSTPIDATDHVEYNEDAPLRFSILHVSQVSQGDP